MVLVGRRDGRNFGYSRQLSYAGPQALKDMFGGGHYGAVKAHSDRWPAFVKWCRSEAGRGSMMHGRLIVRCYRTMQYTFEAWLNTATWRIALHKTRYRALTEPLQRFAVITR